MTDPVEQRTATFTGTVHMGAVVGTVPAAGTSWPQNKPVTIEVVAGLALPTLVGEDINAIQQWAGQNNIHLQPTNVQSNKPQGIIVALGHRAENVGGAAVVTYSPAVAPDNVELVAAGEAGARVAPRSEILAAICATRRCLAVSGTHGKTTTASMLSLILVEAGLQPSFVIGADVNEIGTNAVWDSGEWLVVEADEMHRGLRHRDEGIDLRPDHHRRP